jgi:hypothetical protein
MFMSAARDQAVPVARALAVPCPAGTWAALGFAPDEPIGEVRMTMGAPELALEVDGLAVDRPDGLALVPSGAGPAGHARHPNGATVIDHVVALTDDMDRTIAALRAAGLELRRERRPPESPVRQAFFNLRTLVLEVVEVEGDGPAMWGVTVVVADHDATARELGPLLGTSRPAVQAGRRIATVTGEAGLPIALAFMTPRPQRPPAS